MKKLNIIFLILFAFLYGCGFESIHQKKNVDFSIIKFETKGEKKISKYLTLYLSGLQKNQNANRSYEIVTNSTINKKITSKNSRGEAQNHSIEVIVEVTVKQNSSTKTSMKSVTLQRLPCKKIVENDIVKKKSCLHRQIVRKLLL